MLKFEKKVRRQKVKAEYVGSRLPTFRDILSVPSSRVKQRICPTLEDGPINDYQHTLRNIAEERRPALYCGAGLKSLTELVNIYGPAEAAWRLQHRCGSLKCTLLNRVGAEVYTCQYETDTL